MQTVIDIEGNSYPIVTINGRTWMAANLITTLYRNGDPVPQITDDNEWKELSKGGYGIPYNINSNIKRFGLLYNKYAAGDPRGLCPVGWHLPTTDDLNALIISAGSSNSAVALKSKTGWDSGICNNSSGMKFLPAGLRDAQGIYLGLGTEAYCWAEDPTNIYATCYLRLLASEDAAELRCDLLPQTGLSVRCVKD